MNLISCLRLCLLLCVGIFAHAFAAQPVTIVVPYPAGGLSDLIARNIQPRLAKALGQPVIIENLGGAGGGIAAQKVLHRPADGLVLFQGSPNELILSPLLNPALQYQFQDFRLVQLISVSPLVLLARKDLPVNNIADFTAYARTQAQQKKPLTYASVGIGSLYHLLGNQISQRIDAPMTHIPYKGGAAVLQDLMGGLVDIYITPMSNQYIDLVRQGQLKALAVLSAQTQPALPHTPALHKSPQFNGFIYETWSGYFVKKETPEPVVQALHRALVQVIQDPSLREQLEQQSMTVATPQNLSELDQIQRRVWQQYESIARAAKINP